MIDVLSIWTFFQNLLCLMLHILMRIQNNKTLRNRFSLENNSKGFWQHWRNSEINYVLMYSRCSRGCIWQKHFATLPQPSALIRQMCPSCFKYQNKYWYPCSFWMKSPVLFIVLLRKAICSNVCTFYLQTGPAAGHHIVWILMKHWFLQSYHPTVFVIYSGSCGSDVAFNHTHTHTHTLNSAGQITWKYNQLQRGRRPIETIRCRLCILRKQHL